MQPYGNEIILSWNIGNEYETDLPYYRNEITKSMEEQLDSKKVTIPNKLLKHFPSYKLEIFVQTLFKVRLLRKILTLSPEKLTDSLIKSYANELFDQLKEVSFHAKHRSMRLEKTRIKKYIKNITPSILPENQPIKKEDLWKYRKKHVIDILKKLSENSDQRPTVIMLQGMTLHQLNFIHEKFDSKHWHWIASSTATGVPALSPSINQKINSTYLAIILNKRGWSIPLAGNHWFSKSLVITATAINLKSKQRKWLLCGEFEIFPSVEDLRKFLPSSPYFFGITTEEPLQLDSSYISSHFDYNPGVIRHSPSLTGRGTYFKPDFPLDENIHDAILHEPKMQLLGSSICPIVFDGKSLVSPSSPQFQVRLKEHYLASPHFLLTTIPFS